MVIHSRPSQDPQMTQGTGQMSANHNTKICLPLCTIQAYDTSSTNKWTYWSSGPNSHFGKLPDNHLGVIFKHRKNERWGWAHQSMWQSLGEVVRNQPLQERAPTLQICPWWVGAGIRCGLKYVDLSHCTRYLESVLKSCWIVFLLKLKSNACAGDGQHCPIAALLDSHYWGQLPGAPLICDWIHIPLVLRWQFHDIQDQHQGGLPS